MSTSTNTNVLHICYIHGWKGDHTSFQSFPTAVDSYIRERLPHIDVNTHIYPTYPASRPIQVAVQNLLKWMDTLPDGNVFLAGHSLGGFLVADAALEVAKAPKPRHPVIGVIAFDVPFLGIHPHVVISGLATLRPKDAKDEQDMNDLDKVNIVEPIHQNSDTTVANHAEEQALPTPSVLAQAMEYFMKDKHPFHDGLQYLTEFAEFGACVVDVEEMSERYLALEKWGAPEGGVGDWIHFFTEVPTYFDDKNTILSRQNSPTPPLNGDSESVSGKSGVTTSASTVGAVEVDIQPYGTKFTEEELGATGMALEFEKLKEKARRDLEKRQKNLSGKLKKIRRPDEGTSSGLLSPNSKSHSSLNLASHPSSPGNETPPLQEGPDTPPSHAHDDLIHHHHYNRHHLHFIVLPRFRGYRWQRIPIAGVDDEVAAHTAVFFPKLNLEYDDLVKRTGAFVIGVAKKRGMIPKVDVNS